MIRAIFAVVAGYALWTVLWLAGNVGLAFAFSDEYEVYAEGGAIDAVGFLVGSLVLSFVCSWLAGLTTSSISKQPNKRAVLIMAIFLLVTGVSVQLNVWDQMPVWYHLTFLILLIPVCMQGARVKATD